MIPQGGWVYIVRIKDGPYKIGLTIGGNPRQRIAQIQHGLPYDLEVIGLARTDNPALLERDTHALFQHKRIRGEWFNLEPTDIELLLTSSFSEPEQALKDAQHWIDRQRNEQRKQTEAITDQLWAEFTEPVP